MEIHCPHCQARYEVEFPALPAKVFCPACASKCLVLEDGSTEILEVGTTAAASPEAWSADAQPQPEADSFAEAESPRWPTDQPADRSAAVDLSSPEPSSFIPAPPRRAAVETPLTTSPAPAHGPAPIRPTPRAAAPVVVVRRKPAWSGPLSIVGLLFAAAIVAIALHPDWRQEALARLGPSPAPAVVEEPAAVPGPEDAPVPPTPNPVPVITTPEPPPVLPPPDQGLADEVPDPVPDPDPVEVPTATGPATLASAAPEIAQALSVTDQRIAAATDQAEAEVRTFLSALYQRPVGGAPTRAATLTSKHPELMLNLLGDLWGLVERSPDASLPTLAELKITNARSAQSFDLTSTYRELLTQAAADGPVEAPEWATLATDPQFQQLLGHFAGGEDPRTVDNALILGQMVANARLGKPPLAGATATAAAPKSLDELPEVDGSVDLADFQSARELIEWAHAIQPTGSAPVAIPGGPNGIKEQKRSYAYVALPAEVLLPHPSAADFPGEIPADVPRVEKEVTINLALPRWQATGLYAAPGEPVTLRVPSRLQRENLRVCIGSHTDNLVITRPDETASLRRFPQVANSFPLNDNRVVVGNPFGGQIFIEVPINELSDEIELTVNAFGDAARAYPEIPEPEPVTLAIAGAVEMPTWTPGMPKADWSQQLKKNVPWTELNFGTICMTVPTAAAAEVSDMQELCDYWQTVMQAEWSFGGFPGQLYIPQRVNWDRQISVGYMHSGYPIGAPASDVMPAALDFKALEHAGSWGLFHEIGHNHQPIAITPEGFTEVTVNLFSLAAMAGINPKGDPNDGHPALADPDALLASLKDGGSDAFVLLATYLPGIEEFGLESLTKTFQVYWEEDNENGQLSIPASNKEKQDRWVRRYGEVVQRNVAPFFESVNFHVSESTRDALAKYEDWNP